MPGTLVTCRTSTLASFDLLCRTCDANFAGCMQHRAVQWSNARCRLALTREMSRSSQVPQHLYSSTTVDCIRLWCTGWGGDDGGMGPLSDDDDYMALPEAA